MSDEQFKLLMVMLGRIEAALGGMRSDWRVGLHDIRATREKVDVIESRTPYIPMDHEVTNGGSNGSGS